MTANVQSLGQGWGNLVTGGPLRVHQSRGGVHFRTLPGSGAKFLLLKNKSLHKSQQCQSRHLDIGLTAGLDERECSSWPGMDGRSEGAAAGLGPLPRR